MAGGGLGNCECLRLITPIPDVRRISASSIYLIFLMSQMPLLQYLSGPVGRFASPDMFELWAFELLPYADSVSSGFHALG